MKSTEFKKIVTKNLTPFLREKNWKGSGFYYTKNIENIIRIITIQPSRSGGKFCIEIGIHFDFIPLILPKDFSKIKTWDVDIHDRLTPDDFGDFWWDFPSNGQIENILFEEIKGLIIRKAEPYFDKYNNWKENISELKVTDIENGKSKKMFPIQPLRTILMIARINMHLGKNERAIEFSRYGLSVITGNKGSALIPIFNDIIEKASR